MNGGTARAVIDRKPVLGVVNVLGLILTAFGATFVLPLVTALIAADGTATCFLLSGLATAGIGYGIATATGATRGS